MRQVLQPLEVRAGDTAAIGKQVRHADDALFSEDLLSCEGGWAVSSFEDCLALELARVAHVDTLLDGGRDDVLHLLLHEYERVLSLNLIGTFVTGEAALIVDNVLLDFLDIEAIRLMDRGISLDNGRNDASVLDNELGYPIADVTEALHRERLVFDALRGVLDLLDEAVGVEQLKNAIVYAKAS